MTTKKSTFTLQRIFSLALILSLMAGMLPMPDMAMAASAELAEASVADHTELAEVPPGLQAAIDAAFGPQPGIASAPAEEAKLTASDGVAGDFFGRAVSISGDLALVGAPRDESEQGAAYIFARNQGGADTWGQAVKLTASDGALNDWFGVSVALSGDTALVSAFFDDDNGGASGSAYLFTRNTGGADNWGQAKKLTASDGAAGDQFGHSVALSGDTALIGAQYDDDNGAESGSAYVFERNMGGADNWGEVSKLTASDGGADDWFGYSVSIDGDTALVGAHNYDGAGTDSGAAYIFYRNQGGADNWGEMAILTSTDAFQYDIFGVSVAISGDRVVIGVPWEDENGAQSGSAYIFERNQGGVDKWGQVRKISASDGAASDTFGDKVAISGDTIVVGVKNDDTPSGEDAGSAYVFSRNEGGIDKWGEVVKLTASDATADDELGYSVAIDNHTLIAGVLNGENGSSVASGTAYIFTGRPYEWKEQAKTTPADGFTNDHFGYAVALDGDLAIVGAQDDDDNGSASGSAYIFERNQNGLDTWDKVVKLTPADGAAGDWFGHSVALSGDTALVGARGDDTGQGSAYIFERNTGGSNNWGEVAKLTASDGAASDRFGITVALSGDTALVGANKEDANGTFAGAAYLYTRNTGGINNWGEVKKIISSDIAAYDEFGISVALSGDTGLVGAVGESGFIGAAYLFERNTGGVDNWGEVVKLVPSDGATSDFFGMSVALSGDTALVGSPYDDDNGDASGSAYIFERNTGGSDNWGEVVKLTASDGAVEDYFGMSVSIDSDTALVGAVRDLEYQGSAYLFERNQGGAENWGQVKKLTGSDSIANDRFADSVAISGDVAFIGAWGDDDYGSSSGSAYIFVGGPKGTDTIGTLDPATGNFLLRNTNDAGAADLDFLFAADITDGIPLGGDWDGDGVDTIGVFSPSLGEFRLRNSNDAGAADITLSHPILVGEQPIVGDWDGDGTDTIGIFMDGKVYMRNTNSIAKPDIAFNFGKAGDIPLGGDWDGDGIDTIGVFDPAAGEFQLRNSNSSGAADITIQHKVLKNRTPLAGDWDGDGVDTLGIYVNGKVLLRNTNTIGPPDLKFNYGGAGLLPVTGDWDGG